MQRESLRIFQEDHCKIYLVNKAKMRSSSHSKLDFIEKFHMVFRRRELFPVFFKVLTG